MRSMTAVPSWSEFWDLGEPAAEGFLAGELVGIQATGGKQGDVVVDAGV